MREGWGTPTAPWYFLEGGVEVEDVGHLEADSVYQDQVSTYEYVAIARIGRRKHDLQLLWARLHSATKARRQRAVHDQLALEPWRQAITLGEPARKMRVVGTVPAVDVAVTILVVSPTVTMAVFTGFMAVALIPIMVIAVVFAMTVAVALGHGHRGGERERDDGNCAGAEPEF
jgi:hypothetical protein